MNTTTIDLESLKSLLSEHGQDHVLAFWDELSEEQRQFLGEQIDGIDWPTLELALQAAHDDQQPLPVEQAQPPQAIQGDQVDSTSAREVGEAALRSGKVGMILVAGGQGSRLGFDHPKGMFPIGPVSGRTLFQVIVDRLKAVGRRYQTEIPLYIMTSPATHPETVEYFASHDNLGLADGQLSFFCQDTMPAVDAETKQLLMSEKHSLFLSPNGHGGMLAALAKSGCLDSARERGVEHFFYGQVDNPLLQICDPYLIGHHLQQASQVTTQVVRKRDWEEKVGNVVVIDGKTRIIEYSDLPESAAQRREPDGSLSLWAGNIAVHVFELDFLDRMLERADALPFHQAHKRTRYVDADGRHVEPEAPNALKFERFIFDLLPAAERTLVVEVQPAEAFAPVKNAAGQPRDTAATSQAAIVQLHRGWLTEAGTEVAEGVNVEIHPNWALESQDVIDRPDRPARIANDTFLES